MTRTRTPRLLLLGAAAAAVGAAAGVPSVASAADDGGDQIDVVVEDAGDQSNAITLPAAAEVGQRASTTMVLDMDIGIEGSGISTDAGVGMEIAMTSEVVELTPEGGYVALSTLDSVEITEMPEGTGTPEFACLDASGTQLRQTFDAAGNALSMEAVEGASAEGQACADELASTQSQATVVYPSEPVGPGAKWSADLETVSQGITIPVTYNYTLTEVSDGRFTVDVTFDSDFDVDQSGIEGSGTMSGTGSTTGAIDNVLDVNAAFDVAMTMESTGEGAEFSMDLDMGIEMTSEVPAA